MYHRVPYIVAISGALVPVFVVTSTCSFSLVEEARVRCNAEEIGELVGAEGLMWGVDTRSSCNDKRVTRVGYQHLSFPNGSDSTRVSLLTVFP